MRTSLTSQVPRCPPSLFLALWLCAWLQDYPPLCYLHLFLPTIVFAPPRCHHPSSSTTSACGAPLSTSLYALSLCASHVDKHAAPMMLTFPSMKDRSWKLKNPLQHTAQVLILSKASWFTSKDLPVNPTGYLLLRNVSCMLLLLACCASESTVTRVRVQ